MEFAEVIGKYALATIVMALIVMVLVGVVKVFTKVLYKGACTPKRKEWMSRLYLLLSLTFSVLVVLFYYLIFKMNLGSWEYAKDIAMVYSCTQVIYPLYRKYGGRVLFGKVINLFKGKNKGADSILEIIEQIVMLTDEQREELKTKLVE